jgi:hypothetical protein
MNPNQGNKDSQMKIRKKITGERACSGRLYDPKPIFFAFSID